MRSKTKKSMYQIAEWDISDYEITGVYQINAPSTGGLAFGAIFKEDDGSIKTYHSRGPKLVNSVDFSGDNLEDDNKLLE